MAKHTSTSGNLLGREPALWVGAVTAALALAVGFGLPVTTEQTGLILAAVSAVLALVTRQQVAPMMGVISYKDKAGRVHDGPGDTFDHGAEPDLDADPDSPGVTGDEHEPYYRLNPGDGSPRA